MLGLPSSNDVRLPLGHRPSTTGGPPQVVRVMPGAQATPFVVRWERANATGDYLLGRRVFDYERIDLPLIRFEDGGVRINAPGQW